MCNRVFDCCLRRISCSAAQAIRLRPSEFSRHEYKTTKMQPDWVQTLLFVALRGKNNGSSGSGSNSSSANNVIAALAVDAGWWRLWWWLKLFLPLLGVMELS